MLQNKLTRAQYLDEVTWTTKNWLGLQKQRISVVLHTAIAEQVVNELCGFAFLKNEYFSFSKC